MITLEPVSSLDDLEWDRTIAPWRGSLIYHRSAWLNFLTQSRPGLQPVRHSLVQNGRTCGYFAGFIENRGPFRFLGSPLYGWLTDFMGPVCDQDLNIDAFLKALESWCRQNRIHFIQLGNPMLPRTVMEHAGYAVNDMRLYRIPLSNVEQEMWQNITGKCRNRIRKGLKNGLSIEQARDETIVGDYYAQHKAVFANQGLPPKYSIETVKALVRNLMASDMLLAIRIRANGETVATGIFPHDRCDLYSFGIAAWINSRRLCPNELLYWSAMKWGGTHGLRHFTIGGKYREPPSGGVFKEKFNAEEVPFLRYTKALSPILRAVYWMQRRMATSALRTGRT